MEMNLEQRIAASPQQVWAALNDVAVLRSCIPGCESLEATGENSFAARVVTRIGPVKAGFDFVVTLTDLDPPRGYTINGKGQGGAAGFANGSAVVTLRPEADHTLLAYQAKAQIGGKLAQLGSRLVDATAAKLAAEFFENFNRAVAPEPAAADTPAAPSESSSVSVPRWVWVLVLGLLAMAGYFTLR